MPPHPGGLTGALSPSNHMQPKANRFNERPDIAVILLNDDANNAHEAFIHARHLFFFKAFIDHSKFIEVPAVLQAMQP